MKDESIQRDVFNRLFATRRRRFTLRMAPMIDMIFLLLIFFLVAAKWRPEEDFLPFKLPTAQAQDYRVGAPEPLLISISATATGCIVRIGTLGSVQIHNQRIEQDLVALMEKMQECLTAQKRYATDPIEIICSPEIKWQYVAKIYNIFFGAGLTDITFRMTE